MSFDEDFPLHKLLHYFLSHISVQSDLTYKMVYLFFPSFEQLMVVRLNETDIKWKKSLFGKVVK